MQITKKIKSAELINVSALTAYKLGLLNLKTDADSKQAYLMLGSKCSLSCSFCAQANNSYTDSRYLSRVIWPAFPISKVIEKFKNTSHGFKKICFQVVSFPEYFKKFIQILKIFKNEVNLPVSGSISVFTINQIDILFKENISTLGFAIDAIGEKLYLKIKKRNWKKDIELLKIASKKYPGRISVHIIAGLGETDYELFNFLKFLKHNNIIISLFAFTPVKGTELENYPKISIERYRLIQLITNLIIHLNKKEIDKLFKLFKFNDSGYIQGIDGFTDLLKTYSHIIQNGKFLKTIGCPYCNRPFYNESPGKMLYNYPFEPSKKEIENSIELILNYFEKNLLKL